MSLLAIVRLERSESYEYFTALEHVPELVEQESPLWRFLHVVGYNADAAAKRLARFWKYRKLLFGPKRWLLPMTQTGAGALDDLDIQLLRSGVVLPVVLEKTKEIVYITDITRATKIFGQAQQRGVAPELLHDRCVMYLSVISNGENEASMRGTIFLRVVNSRERPNLLQFNSLMWEMARDALPAVVTKVVIAQTFEDGKMELLDYLRYMDVMLVGRNAAVQPLEIRGNSAANTAGLLETCGFPRNVMPLELGGAVDFDCQVSQWVNMRLTIESLFRPISAKIPTASLTSSVIVHSNNRQSSPNGSTARILIREAPSGAELWELLGKTQSGKRQQI